MSSVGMVASQVSRQIPLQMSELGSALDRLEKEIDMLREQLSPAMVDVPFPPNPSEADGLKDVDFVPLAMDILERRRRLDALCGKLSHLRDGLIFKTLSSERRSSNLIFIICSTVFKFKLNNLGNSPCRRQYDY